MAHRCCQRLPQFVYLLMLWIPVATFWAQHYYVFPGCLIGTSVQDVL